MLKGTYIENERSLPRVTITPKGRGLNAGSAHLRVGGFFFFESIRFTVNRIEMRFNTFWADPTIMNINALRAGYLFQKQANGQMTKQAGPPLTGNLGGEALAAKPLTEVLMSGGEQGAIPASLRGARQGAVGGIPASLRGAEPSAVFTGRAMPTHLGIPRMGRSRDHADKLIDELIPILGWPDKDYTEPEVHRPLSGHPGWGGSEGPFGALSDTGKR